MDSFPFRIVIENDQIKTYFEGTEQVVPLGSPEGFAVLSKLWLLSGWDTKHQYIFTWHNRPVIQEPEDMVRLQEVIWTVQPDVIIECGVAHGGALVFYAGLCKLFERGRVIGVDVEIRPHNRRALEAHPLHSWFTLIEGSSVDPAIVEQVRSMIKPGEKVMVMLDSDHTKEHVLKELEHYSPMVSVGSYIIAMDGIKELVAGRVRTTPDWVWNNPKQAALEFVDKHPDYIIEAPPFLFNESGLSVQNVSYFPCGYIKRVR